MVGFIPTCSFAQKPPTQFIQINAGVVRWEVRGTEAGMLGSNPGRKTENRKVVAWLTAQGIGDERPLVTCDTPQELQGECSVSFQNVYAGGSQDGRSFCKRNRSTEVHCGLPLSIKMWLV